MEIQSSTTDTSAMLRAAFAEVVKKYQESQQRDHVSSSYIGDTVALSRDAKAERLRDLIPKPSDWLVESVKNAADPFGENTAFSDSQIDALFRTMPQLSRRSQAVVSVAVDDAHNATDPAQREKLAAKAVQLSASLLAQETGAKVAGTFTGDETDLFGNRKESFEERVAQWSAMTREFKALQQAGSSAYSSSTGRASAASSTPTASTTPATA